MERQHCRGCRHDHYNDTEPNGCWTRASAVRILRRRVAMSERPPWRAVPEQLPNCYAELGFVFVGPTTTK